LWGIRRDPEGKEHDDFFFTTDKGRVVVRGFSELGAGRHTGSAGTTQKDSTFRGVFCDKRSLAEVLQG
jgi:hypothetical protein